jgi:hypothetical protein
MDKFTGEGLHKLYAECLRSVPPEGAEFYRKCVAFDNMADKLNQDIDVKTTENLNCFNKNYFPLLFATVGKVLGDEEAEKQLSIAYESSGGRDWDDLVQWRPLLDQSALKPVSDATVKPSNDKPVFTQEMADRDGLPPIKSEVALSEDVAFYCHQHQRQLISAEGSIVLVTGYATRPDNGAVNVTLFNVNGKAFATINPDYVNPIDTRTDKEKAVDDVMKVVSENAMGILSLDGTACRRVAEAVIGAGYHKTGGEGL